MLENVLEAFTPSKHTSLAKAFSRLGWIGFWIQILLGSVPVLLMIYVFVFARTTASGERGGVPLVEYLTIASLLLLCFTTLWSYRYTIVAKRIADPQQRPPETLPARTAWTGVLVSMLGVLLSMIVMLIEVAHLLFYFLKVPQVGVPAIQTTGGGSTSWVSAVDIMNLMALMLAMFSQLIILIFSLWLLFRTTVPSIEFAQPAEPA
jgi:hypothetical protein